MNAEFGRLADGVGTWFSSASVHGSRVPPERPLGRPSGGGQRLGTTRREGRPLGTTALRGHDKKEKTGSRD